MLPKELRLKGKKQFDLIYSQGLTRANELIVLKALPNGLEVSRFGFAVGMRLGKAVERNKLKRRLREIVRSLPIKEGWDIIFIPKKGAIGAEFPLLKEKSIDLLSRGKLLKV